MTYLRPDGDLQVRGRPRAKEAVGGSHHQSHRFGEEATRGRLVRSSWRHEQVYLKATTRPSCRPPRGFSWRTARQSVCRGRPQKLDDLMQEARYAGKFKGGRVELPGEAQRGHGS